MSDINGALKLLGLPDLECFKSFQELLVAMPSMFAVVIPDTVTNVTVSNIQPLDSEHDHVWFRFSNGGTFIGIYLFSNGSWEQRYPAPGEVQTVVGDSRTPPGGYITTNDAPWLTAPQKAHFVTFWHLNVSTLYYDIFTVVPVP